ncbi:Prohormone convertase 1 [Strongyloides ratti]|uniref:Prohormone convertase 1 n=1 Tax=Strongyloides ratti TaxID=34506 RepID=A0A090LDJ4_STRRB|nr:Prohormone convertase 1 [Strongyloides ratti]CEF65590.1 Prohormone convertase 1 [Strongyloides ratti]
MQIPDVWKMGYTGKNVVVTIIDDGVDYRHPDLIDNYLPEVSINFVENNYDPRPPLNSKISNDHGTNCAGLIAMKANNSICGVGVAFEAKFGAIRLVGGEVTSLEESKAFSYNVNKTDIFSSSWGPPDDGKTLETVHSLVEEAISNGVMYGRKKKGSIFIFASGNGGIKNDSCTMDGLASHVFTFPVSAVGPSFQRPSYSEKCSTALISTFSNSKYERDEKESLLSTGIFNKCDLKSVGTSASAPLFAGIVALVLEARNNLTWRDLKYITILTANPIPMILESNNNWIINGAGFLHNPYFGFGLANAKDMVTEGILWEHVPGLNECQIKFQNFEPQKWEKNTLLQGSFYFSACSDTGNKIIVAEYIQLKITTQNVKRGSIQLWLNSPSNTQLQLIYERNLDNSTHINNYAFNSVAIFGENPEGIWNIEIADSSGEGVLKDITFSVFGTTKKSKYLETKKKYGLSDIHKYLKQDKRNFEFKNY